MAGPAMAARVDLAHTAALSKLEPPMAAIVCERSAHLAHISLNRPGNGNRFSTEMLREMGRIFTEANDDPGVRCILLTAKGEDYSLGVDVPDVLPRWAAGQSPFEPHQGN